MRTAAHLQQLQGVAVVGYQHLQGRDVHWCVVNLDRGQRFGVDEHDGQCGHEIGLETGRWKHIIPQIVFESCKMYAMASITLLLEPKCKVINNCI